MPVISNYQRYAGVCARPTGFGDITLYCDGGSINFKIVPGLTIEAEDS
ncbi:hypothetical protein ACNGMK_09490 [Campylobacter coli]